MRSTPLWFGTFLLAAVVSACVGDSATSSNGDAGSDGQVGCSSTEKLCATGCVKLSDPATGCSSIQCAACPADTTRHQAAICTSAGQCGYDTTCAAGYADCDKNPGNGCEAATDTDVANCGACGNTCGNAKAMSAPTCAAGKCKFTCTTGYAHCGAMDSSGCDTQVDGNDPKNCGACGHDCLGATCSAGVCQPLALATNELYPTTLAVDSGSTGYAYWTNWKSPGSVRRVPKDLSSAVASIATNQTLPYGIVLTQNYVYWGEYSASVNTNVHFANKDGTSPQTISPATLGVWGLAADSTNVYWVNRWDTKQIMQATIGSTSASAILTGNANSNTYTIQAEDGMMGHVFTGGPNTGLTRYDKTGQNPLQLDPTALGCAIDANDAFYGQGKTVYRIGKDKTCNGYSPCPKPIATTTDPIGQIAVDASYVYFSTIDFNKPFGTSGSVFRVQRDGTGQVELVKNQGWLSSLALDNAAVFWAIQCTNCGSVWKLAK